MISNKRKLQPGNQVVQETKAGAAHGKHVLQEALLAVAGPEVQIIHIKPLDRNAAVYKKAKS